MLPCSRSVHAGMQRQYAEQARGSSLTSGFQEGAAFAVASSLVSGNSLLLALLTALDAWCFCYACFLVAVAGTGALACVPAGLVRLCGVAPCTLSCCRLAIKRTLLR